MVGCCGIPLACYFASSQNRLGRSTTATRNAWTEQPHQRGQRGEREHDHGEPISVLGVTAVADHGECAGGSQSGEPACSDSVRLAATHSGRCRR